jgi:hypothetical protein
LRTGWRLLLAASVAMGSVGSSAAQTVSDDLSRVALPEAPQPQGPGLVQQPQKPSEPSLSDLGYRPTRPDRTPTGSGGWDRHTEMLKIHQRVSN